MARVLPARLLFSVPCSAPPRGPHHPLTSCSLAYPSPELCCPVRQTPATGGYLSLIHVKTKLLSPTGHISGVQQPQFQTAPRMLPPLQKVLGHRAALERELHGSRCFVCWFDAVPVEASAEQGEASCLPDRPLMATVSCTAAGKAQDSPWKLQPFLTDHSAPGTQTSSQAIHAQPLVFRPQTVGSLQLSPFF